MQYKTKTHKIHTDQLK